MKHGTLRLSGVGKIAIRCKPRTLGTPKTCEFIKRGGKWYASIALDCEPVRERGEKVGGLDWGAKAFATVRLRKAYARLHEKVATQRKDFLHQTAVQLVTEFAALGLEALNIKNMTVYGGQYKKGLNRSILDAAGDAFRQIHRY